MTEKTENHAVDDEQTTAGEETGESSPSPAGEGGAAGDAPSDGNPKTYDEAYVRTLRDEAAAGRVKAKRADAAEARLRALAITAATSGVLADPTDLAWSDEFADDEGWPDPTKIMEAATALIGTKPHLGRPTGDVGQGKRGDDVDAFSLTDIIRSSV